MPKVRHLVDMMIIFFSEPQMLLDLIKETVSICPETFISTVQHPGAHLPLKPSKLKLCKYMLCTRFAESVGNLSACSKKF